MPKFEASRAKLLAIPVDGNVEYVEWAEDESPYKVLSRTLVDEGHSTEIVVDEAIRYFVVEGLRSAGLHVREFPSEVRAIRERKTSIELDILQCANEVCLHFLSDRSTKLIGLLGDIVGNKKGSPKHALGNEGISGKRSDNKSVAWSRFTRSMGSSAVWG